MRKETKRASGIEEGRKLGNSEGVMPGVPWAPKRSRDHIQRRRAVGKVSAYVGRACENKGRVPRVSGMRSLHPCSSPCPTDDGVEWTTRRKQNSGTTAYQILIGRYTERQQVTQ